MVIFRAISIISVVQTYLEMLFPLYFINMTLCAQREPLADTKCPPAAQRKQAKRPCIQGCTCYLLPFYFLGKIKGSK